MMWKQALISKRWLLVAGLAWVALLFPGCGTIGGSKPPQLSLADVGLESVGLFEQRLSLVLRVQNPNASDMEIRGLACTLDVNGQHFAQGASPRPVMVPGFGDALVNVSANVGTGSVVRQLQTLAQGGREAIDYRLQGQIEVRGQGQVPFEQVGDIPLPSLLGQPPQSQRSL